MRVLLFHVVFGRIVVDACRRWMWICEAVDCGGDQNWGALVGDAKMGYS
jgi:hypothetical protein